MCFEFAVVHIKFPGIKFPFDTNFFLCVCPVQSDEPDKELPPAVTAKKQPPAQAAAAAVQPVKAAAVEVSAAHSPRRSRLSAEAEDGEQFWAQASRETCTSWPSR